MQKNINYIKESLGVLYAEEEVESLQRWVLEYVTGYNNTQMHLNKNLLLSDAQTQKVRMVVERLQKGEPIQYIVGESEFLGLVLVVREGVLIPRPETEELIIRIAEQNPGFVGKILDIGTGSGCIALGLKSLLSKSDLSACDISDTALNIATANAEKNNLKVNIFKYDILQEDATLHETYTILVSNPPYVLKSEKSQMQDNVLKYEPELALFVDDDDALLYYKAIVRFACSHLVSGGQLWFEINEQKGEDVAALLVRNNYEKVEILKDIFRKERFVKGVKR